MGAGLERACRRLDEHWLPALLELWRAERGRSGPAGELVDEELEVAARAVVELSRGLTGDRELVGARYLEDPDLLGGYLLFYWPLSYAQAAASLEPLGDLRGKRIWDVGAGGAPCALAAWDQGAAHLHLSDRSELPLALAEDLLHSCGIEAFTMEALDLARGPAPRRHADVVIMGHVLNELWAGQDDGVLRRATLVSQLSQGMSETGRVVLIEPALRSTSRQLWALRDELVALGWPVLAPCLYRGSCPALAEPGEWCHADRAWSPPRVVEQIAARVGLDKARLKMSALVLGARGEPWPRLPEGRLFRVVSTPLHSKGKLRYMGCGPEGRHPLVLQRKHLSEHNDDFEHLERYTVVDIGETTPKGDGLRLGADAHARLVLEPGQATEPS